MKKILIGIGALVALVIGAFAIVMAVSFGGRKDLVDGEKLAGGGVTVVDGFVAAFIVPTPNHSVVLIDSGNDPQAAAILQALKAQNLGPEAVKAVFLTHGHPDHVGGARVFKAPVYAFEGDARLAAAQEGSHGPVTKLMRRSADHSVEVTSMLTDRQPVVIDGLTITPWAVPGHTAGSAAFLVEGTLYLGDSANATAEGKVRAAPGLFTDDAAQNESSLKALAKALRDSGAEVKQLAFAHSGSLLTLEPLASF